MSAFLLGRTMKTLNLIDANHFGMWSASSGNVIGFYLNKLSELKQDFPGELIMLWDGSSWRYGAYCAYKANRKNLDERLQRQKDNWIRHKKGAATACHLLGIRQIVADNYEADDLAAMLCRKTKGKAKVNLLTADRDWLQLYEKDRVRWIDYKESIIVQDEDMFEVTTKGFKTQKQFISAKALCGDVGDNIPSVGDFGIKTALELFANFTTVEDAINATLYDKERVSKCSKRLRVFLDDVNKQGIYYRNLGLVDLNSSTVPLPENLRVINGSVSPKDFALFNARHAIVSHDKVQSYMRSFGEDK